MKSKTEIEVRLQILQDWADNEPNIARVECLKAGVKELRWVLFGD